MEERLFVNGYTNYWMLPCGQEERSGLGGRRRGRHTGVSPAAPRRDRPPCRGRGHGGGRSQVKPRGTSWPGGRLGAGSGQGWMDGGMDAGMEGRRADGAPLPPPGRGATAGLRGGGGGRGRPLCLSHPPPRTGSAPGAGPRPPAAAGRAAGQAAPPAAPGACALPPPAGRAPPLPARSAALPGNRGGRCRLVLQPLPAAAAPRAPGPLPERGCGGCAADRPRARRAGCPSPRRSAGRALSLSGGGRRRAGQGRARQGRAGRRRRHRGLRGAGSAATLQRL